MQTRGNSDSDSSRSDSDRCSSRTLAGHRRCAGAQVRGAVGPVRPICSGRIWVGPSEVSLGSPELNLALPNSEVCAQNCCVFPPPASAGLSRAPPSASFLKRREKARLGLFLSKHPVTTQGQDPGSDPTSQSYTLCTALCYLGLQGCPLSFF